MQMSCASGYVGCLDNTTRLFQAWIQDKTYVYADYKLNNDLSIGFRYSLSFPSEFENGSNIVDIGQVYLYYSWFQSLVIL